MLTKRGSRRTVARYRPDALGTIAIPKPVQAEAKVWQQQTERLTTAEQAVKDAEDRHEEALASDRRDIAEASAAGKSLEGVGTSSQQAAAELEQAKIELQGLTDAVDAAGDEVARTTLANLKAWKTAAAKVEADTVERYTTLLAEAVSLLPQIAEARQTITSLEGLAPPAEGDPAKHGRQRQLLHDPVKPMLVATDVLIAPSDGRVPIVHGIKEFTTDAATLLDVALRAQDPDAGTKSRRTHKAPGFRTGTGRTVTNVRGIK